MKIEIRPGVSHPLKYNDLIVGGVYGTIDEEAGDEVFYLHTDENSLVDLRDGTIWSGDDSHSWLYTATFRTVYAKVVIE